MAGLLDFLDDAGDVAATVGKGTLGLLGGIGEAYLAAKAPAMYKSLTADRNYQRDKKARQQWSNNMPMAQGQQNFAPDAFTMDEASVMQGMDQTDQVYQGATQPGYQEMAKWYGNSPDAIGRTAGGKLITDHYAPRTANKYQTVTTGTPGGDNQLNILNENGTLTALGLPRKNSSGVQIHMPGSGNQGKALLTKAEKIAYQLPANQAYMFDKNGVPQPLKGTTKTQASLEAQSKTLRFSQAQREIDTLVAEGFDPTAMFNVVDKLFLENGGSLGNFFASDQGQRYNQAMNFWGSANLRHESGALLSEDEMTDELVKYFPQPGDSQNVVAQKKRARREVEKGMENEASAKSGKSPTATNTPRSQTPRYIPPGGTPVGGWAEE